MDLWCGPFSGVLASMQAGHDAENYTVCYLKECYDSTIRHEKLYTNAINIMHFQTLCILHILMDLMWLLFLHFFDWGEKSDWICSWWVWFFCNFFTNGIRAYGASANAKWMGISGLLLCASDCKYWPIIRIQCVIKHQLCSENLALHLGWPVRSSGIY